MGFLARIFEIRSDLKWAGRDSEFLAGDDLPINLTDSGANITEKNSIQITTVYKCVDLISKTLATSPLNMFEATSSGKEIARDHHLQRVIHTQPNPLMTAVEYRKALWGHYLLWGESLFPNNKKCVR